MLLSRNSVFNIMGINVCKLNELISVQILLCWKENWENKIVYSIWKPPSPSELTPY